MQIKFPAEPIEKEPTLREKLYEKRQAIFTTALAIGLTIVGLTMYVKSRFGNEQQYFTLHTMLDEAREGKTIDLQSLETLLKAFPECVPSFDQYFMQEGIESVEAANKERFTRINSRLQPFVDTTFTEFSRASMLMQEKKYDEALALSQTILKNLDDQGQSSEYPSTTKWLKKRIESLSHSH